MAKGMLDSLEYRHKVKPLAKRGAPVPIKSTHIKTFDAPIDMTGDVMGKRATSKMNKKIGDRNPSGGIEGTWGAAASREEDRYFRIPSEQIDPGFSREPIARAGQPVMEAQPKRIPYMLKPSAPVASKPSVPNFTPRSIKPTSSRIKDVPMPKKPAATSKVAKSTRNEVHPLQSDNNPVGRGGRGPQISPYRQYMKTAATVKKDIGAGFVPSIGVKLGKKTDLQAPAKNLMPPYGSPAQKSSSAPMKKDITAAGFVPSIGVGSGKKKNDGMPSTFIVDHKKKK